ncbi:MAG: hypothetical protein O9262_04805 [Cyclobacteriaceae bacterium]|nr:hypothetical protein [Cyclobacteriaceae bacterium]
MNEDKTLNQLVTAPLQKHAVLVAQLQLSNKSNLKTSNLLKFESLFLSNGLNFQLCNSHFCWALAVQ